MTLHGMYGRRLCSRGAERRAAQSGGVGDSTDDDDDEDYDAYSERRRRKAKVRVGMRSSMAAPGPMQPLLTSQAPGTLSPRKKLKAKSMWVRLMHAARGLGLDVS
jgi:hypothetical protein